MSGRVFRVVKAVQVLFTCILPFLEERRAHAADGRRGSSVCRTHLEQEGCSVTPRGERGGGRGGELFEFYATFNLRSIFLCDRGKKKRKKEERERRYDVTLYIYIYYIHVAHGPKIKFLRSFFHLGLISSRD